MAAVKHVGKPDALARAVPILAVAGVVVAFYGALQLGHLVDAGDWIAGNPLESVVAWVREGTPWTGRNTLFAVTFGVVAVAAVFFVAGSAAKRQAKRDHVDYRARWLGRAPHMMEAAVRKQAQESNLTVGEHPGLRLARLVGTKLWLWSGLRDTITLIMGTGSGKTTAAVVTIALEAPKESPLWVTSNKPDVVAALLTSRKSGGKVWVFDPMDVAAMQSQFYWDPLSFVHDETSAAQAAKLFAEAGRPLDAKTDAFFDPAGQECCASLLLAAAASGADITQVLKWADRPKNQEAVEILRKAGWHLQASSLEGQYNLFHETRDSVFNTARLMLRFINNKAALPWIASEGDADPRPMFDPDAFVRSRDTMICLSREGVGSFGPLVALLTTAVIEAAERYAKTCPGGRMPFPFILELDEVANVCRIADLPDIYSHAGGRGIIPIAILQSYAQGEDCWGEKGMKKLWGATVVRVVGRGVIDDRLLGDWSALCGDMDVARHTVGTSSGRGGGSKSTNQNWTREPIMPKDEIGALPLWRALIASAGDKPVLAELVPYFRKDGRGPEMNEAVIESKAAYAKLTGMAA